MNEAEVIQIVRKHAERLFPKVCPSCHRSYASVREFLLATERVGPIMSYDAELGNWDPSQPIGTLALSNCACGSTLALSAEGLPLPELKTFLNWIRLETLQRGLTQQELLSQLRDKIDKQILAEPGD